MAREIHLVSVQCYHIDDGGWVWGNYPHLDPRCRPQHLRHDIRDHLLYHHIGQWDSPRAELEPLSDLSRKNGASLVLQDWSPSDFNPRIQQKGPQ